MTLRDADIIDCVNSLGSEDRARLIDFIGFRDVDLQDVDALLAAHANPKTDQPKTN